MKRLLPLVLPLALAACSAPPQGEPPKQATTAPAAERTEDAEQNGLCA